MEEDSGVKAPVTRLRRRLSVEQSDDVKSPGPATPTKKRGGRLAAKPQLELIDEHAADITPSKRTTRKASAKEIVEAAEEKAVTPSRRSTRIKSNTSIVSETTQSYDSPRAKRAARRTSQVGSDSEAPVTPSRQTRRTRKDSTSSIDKLETTLAGVPHITEVIIEEENMSVKSDDTVRTNETSPATRKSPRLRQKESKDRKSIDSASNEVEESKTNCVEEVPKQNRMKDRKSLEQINNVDNIPNNEVNTKDELNVSTQNVKKDRKSMEQASVLDDNNVVQQNVSGTEVNTPDESTVQDNLNNSKSNRKNSKRNSMKSSNDTVDIYENVTKNDFNQSKENIVQETNDNETSSQGMENSFEIKQKNKERKSLEKSAREIETNMNQTNIEETIPKPAATNEIDNKSGTKEVDNLSDTSLSMIKELDKKPKKKLSIMNKSTSALSNSTDFQNKRQRTKSWTVTSLTQENDGLFLSDNETSKKKLKKRSSKDFNSPLNHTGSGDNKNDKSNLQQSEKDEVDSSHTPLKSRKVRSSKEFMSPSKDLSKPLISETISPQGNKENVLSTAYSEKKSESSAKFFEKGPTALLQSTIYYEDSDADSNAKQLDGDQCVPVIDNNLVEVSVPVEEKVENNSVLNQKNDDVNNSCEPMDIDETIPNNVSLTEFSETKFQNKSLENDKQKNVSYSPLIDSSINKSSNKSKRKSSISNLEKSAAENKSTLILSQLKDMSSTEHNVSKSPKNSKDLLSKSVGPADSAKDKTLDKKNLSQDYSTSTPLQQKKFGKLGIQINSSIINTSSIENKKDKSKNDSKKEMSKISAPSESSSEEGSDSEVEENSSGSKNLFIDDEADVASDNYESGDSRDEDERQYEDENEIVEKGETLDSEDDVSNDTDYEKDSFVVSSDEEDNDLLSGSGDDLSMSDKELSMSKKSKKKYDERKQKEQKKASKEMYEARHSLKDSEVSKSKKNKKRQQIESSEESGDSEEEIIAPSKRNRKLRLNSTYDEDIDKSNNSVSKKKSKVKRLSESVCDEMPIQEHQISTINNENVTQNDDPLSINVKIELKTPMKDLNISTVQINENIEEVQVENNVSIMKTNEGTDPLQVTMLGEDDSSISENSEIMNNYDSVLNELNNAGETKTVKSLDISLNLNKKNKKVPKEPIIDELNLTKTKNKKVPKKDLTPTKLQSKVDKKNATQEDTGSTSDSIDLQLLFSEDSNDYEGDKVESTKRIDLKQNDVDNFIPLKRTPGKTNILSTEDGGPSEGGSMKKKNKKRQSRNTDEVEPIPDDNDNGIQIIVDTQGTYENTEKSFNMSLTYNSAKKKSNNILVSFNKEDSVFADAAIESDEAPEEVSYQSEKVKNKKKNRKSPETHTEEGDVQSQDAEKSFNTTLNSNSAKKKKKRLSESQTDQEGVVAPRMNTSLNSSKKDLNVSQSLTGKNEELHNTSLKIGSEKKKKKTLSQSLVQEENIEIDEKIDLSLNKSASSAKKKKQKNKSINISLANEEDKDLTTENAKNQTHVEEISEIVNTQSETVADNLNNSSNRSKKRKRMSSADADHALDKNDELNIPTPSNTFDESLSVGRQNKKRKTSLSDKVAEAPSTTQEAAQKKINKKRKERDDDDGNSVSKIFKENSSDKVLIPRLPSSVLNQLEDKPRKEILESKKSSVISTTPFVVEDTRKRRNKPSKFLEESVYLNDTNIEKKQKGNIKTPKVLPFIPTAITSGSGFTTNFKINVIPQEVQFVAQSKNVANFKNDYLYGKKIKRLGTYETYKKHRNTKMTKF